MAPPAAKKKSKRKGVGIDFKKVKHKVGRKLPAAQNATRVEFKSKAIVLPGQSVGQDKDGVAVNQRNKTLKELFNQLSHYNERVRKDAFVGIRDLFLRHPKELEVNVVTTIQKLSSRFTDVDKAVRHSLLLVLRSIFPNISKNVMKPIIPFVMAHLATAMTHMTADVRLSAFSIIDVLLEYYPSLLVPLFTTQIIDHYHHFLENGGSNNLNSSAMLAVVSSLSRFLSVLRSSSGSDSPSTVGFMQKWSEKIDIQGGISALHGYKTVVAESREDISTSSTNAEGLLRKSFTLASLLNEALLNCWSQCAPAVFSSPVPDQVCLECMAYATKCICLVFEWLESLGEVYQVRLQLRKEYLPSCYTRLLNGFPVETPSVQTVSKVEEFLGALNAGICEIMLHFLVPLSLQEDRFNFDIILNYYMNALCGQLLPSSVLSFSVSECKAMEPYVKQLISFIPSIYECVGEEWRFRVLQVFTEVFNHSRPQSSIKLACVSAMSNILLLESDSRGEASVSEEFSGKWLQSFPRLLWELKHSNPSSSKSIFDTILRLGRFSVAGSALDTEYANLQSPMIPFFCTHFPSKQGQGKYMYGPFLKLPRDCQETAIDVLYYFTNLQPALLKAISACCLSIDDVEVLVRILGVIQLSYSKGQVEVVTYLSFLVTLVVQNFSIKDMSVQETRRKQAITVDVVSRSLLHIGDGETVLKLLERSMCEHLSNQHSPMLIASFLRIIERLTQGLDSFEMPESLQNVLPSKTATEMVSLFLAKDHITMSILRTAIMVILRNKLFGKSLMKELTLKLPDGIDHVYAVGVLTTEICKQEGINRQLSYSDVSKILRAAKEILKEKPLKQLFHLETAISAAFGAVQGNQSLQVRTDSQTHTHAHACTHEQ